MAVVKSTAANRRAAVYLSDFRFAALSAVLAAVFAVAAVCPVCTPLARRFRICAEVPTPIRTHIPWQSNTDSTRITLV